MRLFRVPVIKRKMPSRRKYDGADYLVSAESSEAARKIVADYLNEWDRPLHVGLGKDMTDGFPIAWVHYSLDQREVDVRVKRDPVEAEGPTEATRDPDF